MQRHWNRLAAAARTGTLAVTALLLAPGASAETYLLPPGGVNVIGEFREVRARYEDTLLDIARRYDLGYNEIKLANPDVDEWLPGEGTRIVLPTQFVLPDAPREGVVLNIPEMRLYYYPKPKRGEPAVVVTHPVSIGRQEWKTPLGKTKVIAKAQDMPWYPPQSIRQEYAERGEFLPKVVPPGPENPLGRHSLRLNIPGYLIHGTNKPYGVGMRVTHGCVRMYPEDIRALFDDIPVGTSVTIVNQPYKAGWRSGQLYVEAHPPLDEDRQQFENNRTPAIQVVVAASPSANSDIDWERVVNVVTESHGMPVSVSTDYLDVLAVVNRAQSDVQATVDEVAATLREESR